MRELRISIVVIVTILMCTGVTMVFSSSGIYALQNTGQSAYYLKRHLFFLFVGLCLTIGVMAMDYKILQKQAKPILAFSVFLLVLVLIPGIGHEHNGARRWFHLGMFSFQPSELAKLAMLIYVSDFLSRKQKYIRDFFQGFVPVILVLGAVCLLILKQPDLGTSVFTAVITLFLMFIAGARPLHLGSLIFLALPVVYLLIIRVPYRLARILAFLDPWQDSRGIGFQLSQSQIALGSGGILGIGLGHSMQKLFYLPAAHTDFVLSIIGEELGLLGTSAMLILFTLFIWQGARIAKRTEDPFGYFLATGIVMSIGLQAVINIGVSIGALPTKGLPLPFVSYGGTALIFHMMAVGLLLNISRRQDI